MENYMLLTPQERMQLPQVYIRRNAFQNIIIKSIDNYDKIFSNSLTISGKAGQGKTTLVLQILDELKVKGKIANYVRASGHITPTSLYTLLKDTSTPDKYGRPQVLVLDDTDMVSNPKDLGCIDLLKAALDTKSNSPENRQVYYMNYKTGSTGFKYQGFCIIITNNPFDPDRMSPHLEALLDRTQLVNSSLREEDMFLYNADLIETYVNENPDDLSSNEIKYIVDLFNNEVRRWNNTNAFRRAKIIFSIRLIQKFIDASRMFGESWKQFNAQYQRLNAAADLAEMTATYNQEKTTKTVDPTINPRTGKPYSPAYLYQLKRKGMLNSNTGEPFAV